MDAKAQVRAAMFGRVEEYFHTDPPGDEPTIQLVGVFTASLGQLRGLAVEQQQGEGERQAQHAKQAEIRQRMVAGPMRHLSHIGRSLKPEKAEVRVALVRRGYGLSQERFLATVRNMVATAEQEQELLRTSGMAEQALVELKGMLGEYEQATRDANAGLLLHTGARGKMDTLGRELIQLVRQLDGIVVYRAGKDAGKVAAWKTARNVAWPTSEPVVAQEPVPLQLPTGGEPRK